MIFTIRVWRQEGPGTTGRMAEYRAEGIEADQSFLEMLDTLNLALEDRGEDPIAFDHDCREGICGACSLVIDGHAHGPRERTTACQLYMREFRDGATIHVEPWRAKAFPVIRDLVTDRAAFDRVIQAGGYISVSTGAAPDANAVPIPKGDADQAFDAATCIGCGACVAACPNASAMLFVAAKASHLGLLPQGQAERSRRALSMVEAHDREGFGGCTNHGLCGTACPKAISTDFISRLNRDFITASLASDGVPSGP